MCGKWTQGGNSCPHRVPRMATGIELELVNTLPQEGGLIFKDCWSPGRRIDWKGTKSRRRKHQCRSQVGEDGGDEAV